MIQQRGVHCNTPSAFVQRVTARRAAQYFRLSSADDACRHLYILIIRSSLGPTNQVKIHWGEMQNAPPLPWGLAQRTCCTSLVCKGKSQTHGPTAQRRWAQDVRPGVLAQHEEHQYIEQPQEVNVDPADTLVSLWPRLFSLTSLLLPPHSIPPSTAPHSPASHTGSQINFFPSFVTSYVDKSVDEICALP